MCRVLSIMRDYFVGSDYVKKVAVEKLSILSFLICTGI